MAFRDFALDVRFQSHLPKHKDNLFYNTDGYVCPHSQQNTSIRHGVNNGIDDVMLVQFFLKTIAANPGVFRQPFFPPKSHLIMKVDGVFGPTTQTWIEQFQVHLFRIGRPVLRDGVVDRVLHGTDIGTRGFLYTLAMLNIAMGQVTKESGWDTWWKSTEVPGILRDKIRDPASFF